VYGLWRAKEAGLISIKDGFNLEEYSPIRGGVDVGMRSMKGWRMGTLIG
jgi:hypothetical protein